MNRILKSRTACGDAEKKRSGLESVESGCSLLERSRMQIARWRKSSKVEERSLAIAHATTLEQVVAAIEPPASTEHVRGRELAAVALLLAILRNRERAELFRSRREPMRSDPPWPSAPRLPM